ncbi:carbohydrate kinase family protein [Coraliomargarita sp. SDUM461004]|uniref:Carbohydrate kinase family protein n=1 Tax=Thalassobacterium sedimentorum TaxID=3041258 RepID=A0ABU1AMG1_9BACT|nr:carbohydrate kinase family protein [Coraliomargarita sp. SDUM461004]MDQ8195995.1 carbohydrate kinase family protein [Coraliomargarita sp. SDUM461004]
MSTHEDTNKETQSNCPTHTQAAHTPKLLAVGTFVADYHKVVEHYPSERASSRIFEEVVSPGGAPLNLLINLAKLESGFSLKGAGRIGRDLDGQFITEQCRQHDIDISQLAYDEKYSTGYTDVYTVKESGKHTCFHFDGAGAHFCRNDVQLTTDDELDYLFLGSLGALGQLEVSDHPKKNTQATTLLRDARKRGITTIVEFAPLDSGTSLQDFADTLAEADYAILNDRTAETITNRSLYTENQFDPTMARTLAQEILDTGLHKAVIIQSGSGAVYVGADGSFAHQGSAFLPLDKRAGSAGVDHAFCAGYIDGLAKALSPSVCLRQGIAVSTVCRTHLTPSGGIQSLAACMQFYEDLQAVATSD